MTEEQNSQRIVPYTKVRLVGMGELVVYAVSEDEFRLLERGGPASTFLNLAIFFASVGATFLASLLVSQVSNRAFIVVTVVTVVSLAAGLVMFVLWWKFSGDEKSTIQRIRERARTQREPLTIPAENSGDQ